MWCTGPLRLYLHVILHIYKWHTNGDIVEMIMYLQVGRWLGVCAASMPTWPATGYKEQAQRLSLLGILLLVDTYSKIVDVAISAVRSMDGAVVVVNIATASPGSSNQIVARMRDASPLRPWWIRLLARSA